MPSTAMIFSDNLSRNVAVHLEEATNRRSALATVYLVTEGAGQSPATLDAKRHDRQRFLTFYHDLYGHERPDEGFVSVMGCEYHGNSYGTLSIIVPFLRRPV